LGLYKIQYFFYEFSKPFFFHFVQTQTVKEETKMDSALHLKRLQNMQFCTPLT